MTILITVKAFLIRSVFFFNSNLTLQDIYLGVIRCKLVTVVEGDQKAPFQ